MAKIFLSLLWPLSLFLPAFKFYSIHSFDSGTAFSVPTALVVVA